MRFVKTAALLMSLSIAGFSLCACANEPEPVSSDINIISTQAQNSGSGSSVTEATEAVAASENFAFNYNGYDFIVDTVIDESKLPEDYDYQEKAGCAGVGTQAFYITRSFEIQMRWGADDIITRIELYDDTVSTAEGIRIGNTMDEVKQVYGEPSSERSTSIDYQKGSSKLQFDFNAEGKVQSIVYWGTSDYL